MKSPTRNSTIETLREHIADAKDPIVAGVAVAAISGSLGMALLALTLQVASRRKNFAGDRARLAKLLDATNRESARLLLCADLDIAAYQQYRDSLKRKRGVEAALRRIVESPLEAAASAARGVDLCAEAISLAPLAVVSDLAAAAVLLAGSARAILLTVDVNLQLLPAAAGVRQKGRKKRQELEARSSRQLQRILKKAGPVIARG